MLSRIFILQMAAILTSAASITPDNHKVSFILDFLKAQSKPTHAIIWKNCFTTEEKFELVKRSSSNFNPTTFNRQDSLNRSDFGQNPQFSLFILDLTCTQSPERIIQKVNMRMSSLRGILTQNYFYFYIIIELSIQFRLKAQF